MPSFVSFMTIKAVNTPALRARTSGHRNRLGEFRSDYLKQFVSSRIEKWALPIKASG
jgi:hypothetical protein